MNNKQLETIKQKGRKAAMDGKSEKDCPYFDHRTHTGSVTFSRAFRNAWFDGFREAAKAQNS